MTISSYQVLARKYRPLKFSDLAGQEVLVRTLQNAFSRQRVPHAFLLTGTRGIGKTTTARLIARALNCTSHDGKTFEPCGTCPTCLDILNDRHLDVLEMDAASRTGVNDIRDIIETVSYKPTSATYKIYIIDEVHMLSKSAFNALLKTLEEPPAHAKFIFATTEFHKIPDTIVSRCMRFDLKAFDVETLCALVEKVCGQEEFNFEEEAKWMIARAGNGSARDTLSLLERALTLGDGSLSTAIVQDMLGLADGQDLLNLIEFMAQGQPVKALEHFHHMISQGGDGKAILEELSLCFHALTLILAGIATPGVALSSETISGLKVQANSLNLPAVMRLWQVLQKGLSELSTVTHMRAGTEMILMRLCYLALPLENQSLTTQTTSSHATKRAPMAEKVTSFKEMVALCQRKKEPLLKAFLEHDVALVSFDGDAHQVVLTLLPQGDRENITKLRSHLKDWTGQTWGIELHAEAPADVLSIKQQEKKDHQELVDAASQDPVVQKILKSFPGSNVSQVEKAIA